MYYNVISVCEIEENDLNDAPACDDDAHKAILCTCSYFFLIRWVINLVKIPCHTHEKGKNNHIRT